MSRARLILAALVALQVVALPCRGSFLATQGRAAYGDGSLFGDFQIGVEFASAHAGYDSPGFLSATATAHAAYGALEASAVVSGRDTSYPINFAQAEAAFTDSLTVTGGVGQGFIVYTYTLSGAASGPSEAGAHLFLHHASDPDEELAEDVTHSGSFDSLPHQFTFGASFETRAVLDSLATLAQGQTGDGVCQFDGALTGIAVFDADMRPIGAFTIVSESGTEYPVVPSVATGAVFALAGATRALRRRRL